MSNAISGRNVSLLLVASLLPASGAFAQFNGLVSMPRVFNDFSTSTATISNPNTIPGTVIIDDRNMTDDGIGGNFANRHDILLSSDGGATAHTFQITDPFTISADVTVQAGSNTPRKEAGFRINSTVTGDVLFIVNSDAGEIVAFGGGGEFHKFGDNTGGNGYTPGTTIFMSLTYTPGTGQNAGTLEYKIDRGAGIETSGPLPFSNLEGGPVSYKVGAYAQAGPANASDFVTATFANLTASALPPSLIGDTNDDGVVDLADLNNVLNNFGATGASPGDDNNDGVVDLEDLNRVLNNFGDTAAASALSVVPEPSTLTCLLATLPLATRRRRR